MSEALVRRGARHYVLSRSYIAWVGQVVIASLSSQRPSSVSSRLHGVGVFIGVSVEIREPIPHRLHSNARLAKTPCFAELCPVRVPVFSGFVMQSS